MPVLATGSSDGGVAAAAGAAASAEPAAETTRPLLSICIPTYNRSAWLRASLAYSVSEVASAPAGQVELIVSDNASPDDTGAVVAAAIAEAERKGGPEVAATIRYSRSPTNISAVPNMARCIYELARGKYIWLLGDDDFILPGAVKELLSALEQNADVPLVLLNHRNLTDLEPGADGLVALDKLERGRLISNDLESRIVPHAIDLVSVGQTRFTQLYTLVYRADHARGAQDLRAGRAMWTCIESVLPHAVYIGEKLARLPAYYLGTPVVAASSDIHWTKHLPLYQMVYLPRMFDVLKRNGADPAVLDEQRRSTLQWIRDCGSLDRMMSEQDPAIRGQFSLSRYLASYGQLPNERGRLVGECAVAVLKRIKRSVLPARPGTQPQGT
jgi:hypothetical protein